MNEVRALEPSLMVRSEDGRWHLAGRRCSECGETLFGRSDVSCPGCGGGQLLDILLSDHGSLWSFTVLRNQPPGNRRGKPLDLPQPLGMIELGGAVRVLAPVAVPVNELRIGMGLQLRPIDLYEDDDGTQVAGFCFGEPLDD